MAKNKQFITKADRPNIPVVTVATLTGSRPEGFQLATKYLFRQTYKGPIQWIVIDDCYPKTEMPQALPGNITLEYHRGPKDWRPGLNTQKGNMDLAIQLSKGDYFFTWEDDDFYAPNYLQTMLYFLQRYDAVGEANNRYYALVDRCYIEFNNTKHASLCSTAVRKSLMPVLEEAVCSGENPFFDTSFWRRMIQQNYNAILVLNTKLNIGMKQLPGRTGIGAGHSHTKEQGFTRDPLFQILRNWVGDDADSYIRLATGQPL